MNKLIGIIVLLTLFGCNNKKEDAHCLDGYLVYSIDLIPKYYGFCTDVGLSTAGGLLGTDCYDAIAEDSGSGMKVDLLVKEAYWAKTKCYDVLRK